MRSTKGQETENIGARIFFYRRDSRSTVSPFPLRANFLSLRTGYPPDRLEDDHSFWLSIIHPEDQDTLLRLFDDFKTGRPFEHEYRLIRRDGKTVWLRDCSWPGESPGEIEGLIEECTERKRAEYLKDFLYRISEATASLEDLQGFYSSLHCALEKLMYAENFYVCLQEAKNGLLTFPFFKDQHTRTALPRRPRKGLTEFVLKRGKPLLLVRREDYERLIRSEKVEKLGETPESWLGAPLKEGEETIGAIVVQSYDPRIHFDQEDEKLFLLLADHVVSAINRMQEREELKKTREQLSLLIDCCPDLIFYKDTEGKYVRVNPAFAGYFNLREDEIIGKTSGDIMSLEAAEFCLRSDRAALEGEGPVKSEENLRAADGSQHYFEIIKVAIRDESGEPTGIIAHAHEITRRKLTEERLSSLLRFQEQMLETPLVWIDVLDREGNITFWNKGAELLSGFSKEEVLHSQKVWEWLYPDPDYLKKQMELARDISKITSADLASTVRRKDGEWRQISWYGRQLEDSAGESLGSIFIGVDTTERKKAEEALRASEEKYRSLVENMLDTVFTLTPVGEITYVSSAVEKLTGHNPTDLIHHNIFEFVDPACHQFLKDKFRQRLAGEMVVPYEIVLLRADGGKVPVAINSAALTDAEGTIVGIQGAARDISERKRFEEEVQKARIDAMFSITHEMKAPLMNIGAAFELSRMLPPENWKDRFLEYSGTLERNLSRLRRLIDNVLDSQRSMSTGFKLLPSLVDLKPLLVKVIEDNIIYARTRGIRFSLNLRDIHPLRLDAEAVERMLENIITNALKFSPAGSEVKISLEETNGTARVIVHNQGAGIPSAEIKSIFEPFQRGSESQKRRMPGTGLGLYVARLIAQAHGGKILLKSGTQQGTQVTVYLPPLPEAEETASGNQ